MANVLPLALVLIVIAAGGNAGLAGAQSTPPSSSCTASLVSLSPCLAFLQGGPNNTTPTQGCCTALASVVNTSAACLCQLFTTTNNSLGIPINQTRALALPGACKITTPPLSHCKSPTVSNPPASAPSSPAPVVSNPTPTTPASTPSSPTPVVSNPTPTAKSPATTAGAVPPTVTPNTGGAISPSTKEGPTASANAGSMMGVSMLIQVVHLLGIMGSLTFIISASSI